MRKRNKTPQLQRVASHRKSMMRNMAASLFAHERITTSRAKAKALRPYAEKLITRAKANLATDAKPEEILHNKREMMRHIRDRDVVIKLFEEIGPRFKARKGGYTRIIHLSERNKDSAKMSIIELVDYKEKTRKDKAPAKAKKSTADSKKSSSSKAKEPEKKEKKRDEKEGKWWSRFRRKKSDLPPGL